MVGALQALMLTTVVHVWGGLGAGADPGRGGGRDRLFGRGWIFPGGRFRRRQMRGDLPEELYRLRWRTRPVTGDEDELYLAALQMLNILEGFDVSALGRDSTDFWHLMIEAKKIAYEDRAR